MAGTRKAWPRSTGRGALDQDGVVVGYMFESRVLSRVDIDNESDPVCSFARQLMGMPLKPLQGFGVPAEFYGFANKRLAGDDRAVAQAAITLHGTAHDTI